MFASENQNGEQIDSIFNKLSGAIIAHVEALERAHINCFMVIFKRNEHYIGYSITHKDDLFKSISDLFGLSNDNTINEIFSVASENYMIYHKLSSYKISLVGVYNYISREMIKYPHACNMISYNKDTGHPMCSPYCDCVEVHGHTNIISVPHPAAAIGAKKTTSWVLYERADVAKTISNMAD
jgi:hypothetical protein